jgi:pyrroline-5-carboxylate reductase
MGYELGIIGAGNMAEAIARGLIRTGTLRADQIIASDVSDERRALFENDLKVRCVNDPASAVQDCAVILLAVKPQTMPEVLAAIAPVANPRATVVSIAAGVTCETIEAALSPRPVVRTMPNTPLMVGLGAVAMAPGKNAREPHLTQARRLFNSVGIVVDVREDQLDAVTALSGSGPAYFFYLVECMVRAGVELGLPHRVAHELATQTALGAGTMLAARGADAPDELRRKVTSPKGTTQAAIEHLQACKFDQTVIDALKAADRRSKELGGKAK